MNITIINGSPKPKNSLSEYLISELKNFLGVEQTIQSFHINNNTSFQKEMESIANCNLLIFSFPLYVDGIPSHMIRFLEDLEHFIKLNSKKTITVYSMVNCGFIEGKQNRLALQMIENWCKKAGLVFGQGLGVGGGEMLNSIRSVPIGHGPKKDFGKALKTFADNIKKCSVKSNIFVSPNFPRFAFILAANHMWNSRAKTNKLTKKDLFAK